MNFSEWYPYLHHFQNVRLELPGQFFVKFINPIYWLCLSQADCLLPFNIILNLLHIHEVQPGNEFAFIVVVVLNA